MIQILKDMIGADVMPTAQAIEVLENSSEDTSTEEEEEDDDEGNVAGEDIVAVSA